MKICKKLINKLANILLAFLSIIGTPGPNYKLHIEVQCVTGDSELITEHGKKLRIDQVKGGEMILSLNEKTGELIPAKIKGLLDMGIKPIYQIETEDGKTIRTTGNHPHLVKNSNQKTTNKGGFGDLELVPESGLSTCSQYSRTENLVKCSSVDDQKAVEAPGKVIYLQKGNEIVVAENDLTSVKFVKIKKITKLPPEQVYDIEVEGTHNFVANGIIAHNTYINSNATMTGSLIAAGTITATNIAANTISAYSPSTPSTSLPKLVRKIIKCDNCGAIIADYYFYKYNYKDWLFSSPSPSPSFPPPDGQPRPKRLCRRCYKLRKLKE